MTESETAWVAGIIEGEGCISFRERTSVTVRVAMRDEDVIRRLASTSRVGTVYGPYERNGCVMWAWHVGRVVDVEPLLRAVLPWMGGRRAGRINQALSRLVGNPRRKAMSPWSTAT